MAAKRILHRCAAAGVGRAVAMRFAQEDATLGIISRDRVALEPLAEELRTAGAEVYAA